MEFILPNLGLFFWSALLFTIFFFILRKFAWKPILDALHEREENITNSLAEAQKAREDMEKLNADNEALLREAKAEANKTIKEAKEYGAKLISDAEKQAAASKADILEKANKEIEAEKRAAIAEIKDVAAAISVEVAEKILRKELADKGAQESFAQQLVSELSNN
ncbi:MAG: F0F1 ATP synthase subunit B [Bacteroidota bacterium]